MFATLTAPGYAGVLPASPAASEAALVRIIAADPQGRRSSSVLLQQLLWILHNEPSLPGLKTSWLIHHISDSAFLSDVLALLRQYDQRFMVIDYERQDYARCWTDIGSLPDALHPWNKRFYALSKDQQSLILDYIARNKSLYLFGRNAARNQALQLGWSEAPWAFPWDASCFLTTEAWEVIRPLLALRNLSYLAIPCAELEEGISRLDDLCQPPLADAPPLLGFFRSGYGPFNPQLRHGADDEHDLLRRLGLPGPWQKPCYEIGSWELLDTTPLSDRGQLVQVAWAYRLPPHSSGIDQRDAMRLLARKADMQLLADAQQRQTLRCWTELNSDRSPTPGLAAIAANARAVPPLSVTDKPEVLPGTAERSYVNAVPHWQSLAGSDSALNRSGLLSTSGPVCGDVAQHYDRARFQLMVDCVCSLALDGRLNGNRESFEHAHRLVRSWFLDPATAMIPDGAYARLSAVDSRRNVLDAAIDFRDLYPLLDAITLLQHSGCLSSAEQQQLQEWFDAFLGWLTEGSVSFIQQHSGTSACTWYHLLLLAVAAFLGRLDVAAQVFDNLPGLLARQFRPDGMPASIIAGDRLRHEHLFNLQAWTNLVVLSSALGRDLLELRDSRGFNLKAAYAYALTHLPEAAEFSNDNVTPRQWHQAMQALIQADETLAPRPPLPPLADAATGLPPFWSLCAPIPLHAAGPASYIIAAA